MRPQPDCDQLLQQSYPHFLAQLGTPDEAEAIATFSRCAKYWLERNPPRFMKRSPIELQQDVIQDVILQLTKNGAAGLRTFRDKERPFFFWLLKVAKNRHDTLFERAGREDSLDEPGPDGQPIPEPVAPDANLDVEFWADIIWKYAEELKTDCLLALIARYQDGWEAGDMIFLLGRSGPKADTETYARVSYCLRVLKRLILDAGFRREDFPD